MAQICKFFQTGTCIFGASCSNLHESVPQTGGKPSRSPCVFFKRGTCKQGSACKFSHIIPISNERATESGAETETTRTIPCDFWLKGHCIYGNDCRFSHSSALANPSNTHDITPSEPGSPLDEHEDDGIDKPNGGDRHVDPLENPSPGPSPVLSSEDDNSGEITMTPPPRSSILVGNENGINIIEDKGPEDYPLPPSPASDLSAHMHDVIEGSHVLGISPIPHRPPSDASVNRHDVTHLPISTSDTSSLPVPSESENYLSHQRNTSGDQHPLSPDTPKPNTCSPFDSHSVEYLHPQGWEETEMGGPGDVETHASLQSVTTLLNPSEEDGQEINVDNDSSVTQIESSGAPEPEVILHWSEYADPLVDPSIPFCKFYAQGRCNQGDLCTFRHSLSVNEYALLFREAQPALWSSQAQRVRAGYIKPVSVSTFGICKFYPLGTCRNGDTCTYLHVPPSDALPASQEEETWASGDGARTTPQPDWDPQVCWEYSNKGYCKRGDDCRYRHEFPESREQVGEQGPFEGGELGSWDDTRMPLPGPRVCREYSRTGYCRRGDECQYRHENSEYAGQTTPEQWQGEGGGMGLWNKQTNGRRQPCKYYIQGHCLRGDDCSYLHEDQEVTTKNEETTTENEEITTENVTGWDDLPKNNWDIPLINSWATAEDTEGMTAGPGEVPTEPEKKVSASGLSLNDEATWGVAWSVPEPKLCPFYLKGACRKGKHCTLLHKDSVSSWAESKARPTTWDSSKDKGGRADDNDTRKKDPPWNEDGQDQLTSDGSNLTSTDVVPDDDEKTWSVPWVNDNSIPDKPPRVNAPCLAFGQGYCKWGDACFYLHISPLDPVSQASEVENSANDPATEQPVEEELEATNDQDNQARDRSQEITDVIPRRSMFGCTVKFNTECAPIDVMSASESCRVLLANLSPEVPYDEEFRSDVIGLYGILKDITLNENETAATATIECTDYNKAAEAVAQLDGQTYDSMVITARLDSVAETRLSSPQITHSVKVSWPAPNTYAWVYYPTITIAKSEETRLGGKLFEGRKLKTEFPKPRPRQVGPFPIKVANLPADTTMEAVKALCDGFILVHLGKPSYYTLPISDIRALLEDLGPLNFFDVLPSDRTSTKITAFARFNADPLFLTDLTTLNGVKQPFIGGGALSVQPVYHVKYNTPQRHLQLIRDDFAQLCDKYEGQCSLSTYDLEDLSNIHLSASLENVTAFGHANVALQTLLRGGAMISSGEKVWDKYFDLSSGATAVEKLNAKNLYRIILDKSTQTVRVIGSEKGRQQARSIIPRLLTKVRDSRHVVILDRSTLAQLLDWGMQRLIDDFGANKVTLNVQTPALIVRGETAVYDKVQHFLKSCAPHPEEGAMLRKDESNCVVCYRQPKSPVILSCRHVYCETCLQDALRLSIGHPFSPPICIAMAEVTEEEPPELDLQCRQQIPYTVVRDVLPILDEVSFLRSSFLSYVRSHPEELFFCPTPNCETVYRSREEPTVYRCSFCLVRVCSACRHEYHDGLTCNERSSICPEPALDDHE